MENDKIIELLEDIKSFYVLEQKEKEEEKQKEEKLKEEELKDQELLEKEEKKAQDLLEKEKKEQKEYDQKVLDLLNGINSKKEFTGELVLTEESNIQLTNIENSLLFSNYIQVVILVFFALSLFAKGWLSNGD